MNKITINSFVFLSICNNFAPDKQLYDIVSYKHNDDRKYEN